MWTQLGNVVKAISPSIVEGLKLGGVIITTVGVVRVAGAVSDLAVNTYNNLFYGEDEEAESITTKKRKAKKKGTRKSTLATGTTKRKYRQRVKKPATATAPASATS